MNFAAAREKGPARSSGRSPGVDKRHDPLTRPFQPVSGTVQRSCSCGGGCPGCQKDSSDIQTKLRVSEPGDVHEQEADRVADEIMRMPEPQISRQGFEEEEEEETIQRQVDGDEEEEVQLKGRTVASSDTVSTHEVSSVGQPADGGAPLARSERKFFEPRLGQELGDVRVHTDPRASSSARDLNARAYTLGQDISFGEGEYRPGTWDGRRLLAHELVHTVQQSSGVTARVQRKDCDQALVNDATRTIPVFFPKQKALMKVFNASAGEALKSGAKGAAVGLLQQALVDLGFLARPAKRVDRGFGPDTLKAVEAFQLQAKLPETGIVDRMTLRCLDDQRLHQAVPVANTEKAKPGDLTLRGQFGSRKGTIFFDHGEKKLGSTDNTELERIAKDPTQKCNVLHLDGFMSLDEFLDPAMASLAQERVDAVDTKLAAEGHGTACPLPHPPSFRIKRPQPEAKKDNINFGRMRIVEIPEEVQKHQSTAGRVHEECSATEKSDINTSHPEAVRLLDDTLTKLKTRDQTANDAVATFFGDKKRIKTVERNLAKWRDYVRDDLPDRNLCSDKADNECGGTTAYFASKLKRTDPITGVTQPAGTIVWCPPFLSEPDSDERAKVAVHEAGHASLGTVDFGYDSQRLQRFLPLLPKIALQNTDSYLMLILCLDAGPCALPAPQATDKLNFPDAADGEKAKEAVAWTEKWADDAWQNINWLASEVSLALKDPDEWLDPLPKLLDVVAGAFGVQRPRKSLPTTRELEFISNVHGQFNLIDNRVRNRRIDMEEDAALGATAKWDPEQPGKGANPGTADTIRFGDKFFGQKKRDQVKLLYKEAVRITGIPAHLQDVFTDVAIHLVYKHGTKKP